MDEAVGCSGVIMDRGLHTRRKLSRTGRLTTQRGGRQGGERGAILYTPVPPARLANFDNTGGIGRGGASN
jgi:hypothetical protein